MKQELIKKLIPIIEEFADKVLSSFGDLDKIRKGLIDEQRKYQDLNEDKEKELRDIKARKVSGRREHDEMITALENAKSDYLSKVKEYEELTKDTNRKQKKVDDNLAKSEIEVIRAKEIRAEAETTLDEVNHSKEEYRLKLGSLKADSERIEKDNQKIDDEKKKLSVRENRSMANDIKNNEKALELSGLDTKIKNERNEVNRLIKLYKLNM